MRLWLALLIAFFREVPRWWLTVALFAGAILILLLVSWRSAEGQASENLWHLTTITFYTGGDPEQGTEDCITASGLPLFPGCAASYEGAFPLGTELKINVWGEVIVVDHGIGLASGEPWIDIFLSEAQGGRDMAFLLGRIKLYAKVIE